MSQFHYECKSAEPLLPKAVLFVRQRSSMRHRLPAVLQRLRRPSHATPSLRHRLFGQRVRKRFVSSRPQHSHGRLIDQLLRWSTSELRLRSDTPRLDAELIMAATLGRSRAWIMAHGDSLIDESSHRRFTGLLVRRKGGEPVAYLLGMKEFWSMPLRVTPEVLIPRPETELLVEHALRVLAGIRNPSVLDLGTGSGAIALALVHSRPDISVTATDISIGALKIAEENARRLGLRSCIRFVCGDWFSPLTKNARFDLVVSNPPYVWLKDPQPRHASMGYEPPQALYSGMRGLGDLRQIAVKAPAWLSSGGRLLMEHGAGQGPAVRSLLKYAGFRTIETWRDLTGHPRVSGGNHP